MARVTSMDEESILALFDAKREDDLASFGTRAATENNTTDITAHGISIAQNHSDILAAQASIVSLGTTNPTLVDCTSTTRPTTNLYNGRPIRETDTGREYKWDSSVNDWRIAFAPDRCRVSRNTDQTIGTSSQTTIVFDTGNATEDVDINDLHSFSSNPARITVEVPGVYLCVSNLKWAANASGLRMLVMYKNGGAMNTHALDSRVAPSAAGWETIHQLIEMVYLVPGNYIEMSCYQTSGGNLASQGILDVSWMRPV